MAPAKMAAPVLSRGSQLSSGDSEELRWIYSVLRATLRFSLFSPKPAAPIISLRASPVFAKNRQGGDVFSPAPTENTAGHVPIFRWLAWLRSSR